MLEFVVMPQATEAASSTLKKFPAAKQRRMDALLDKNSTGTITAREKATLEKLVAEAERLMVANLTRLAAKHDPRI